MISNTPLLQAEQLRREFGKLLAVDKVSLTLRRGEVLGLLGLNGAGKSTTLGMLCGVLAPTSGWIRIDGKDISQFPNDTRARLGYLPDTPPLYAELRVGEYLTYSARLHGVAKSAMPAALERAMELCQLGEVANRIIGKLSKGFRQRVGLAQALIHQPELLILDEPSSGLDPVQMIAMRELLKNLSLDCGVLLSTHSLPEVTAICQRVAVIHQGKLIHEESLQTSGGEAVSRHYLRLAQPVTSDDLLSLDCVTAAEAPDTKSWQITVPDAHAGKVITEIVARGWQVLEFSHARNFLEERFAALTVGKDAPFGSSP